MDFFNLENKMISFSINNRGWRRIYLLALMFGWVPQGTTTPPGWSGGKPWDAQNYSTNEGQVVTSADALELAKAISQAIPMLEPPVSMNARQQGGFMWEMELFQRFGQAMEKGVRDPGYIFFDERWSDKLNELVVFCQKGAFKIC